MQREFTDALAARARSWPVDPLSCVVLVAPHTPYGQLPAYLDIDDPVRGRGVLTIGCHFDGTGVRGDRLHNQCFTLPDEPTEFAFGTSGSPAEAAHRTADWCEAVLARPLVRARPSTRRGIRLTPSGQRQITAPPGRTRCRTRPR